MSEISVDMRLKLNKLRSDVAKGGQEIRNGLASSVKGLPQTNSEREEAVQRAADYRAMVIKRRKNRAIEEAYERNRPKPPVLPKADEPEAGPNVFAGLARRFAPAALAAVAVAGAMRNLRRMIDGLSSAIENARTTYAKILQSGGMGQGFIVRRQQLAQVIGVSEQEVMQYGAAINFLNQRLDWSSKILSETNPTLTALGWQFKIINEDMKAAFATLANDAAPAITVLALAIDELVKLGPKIASFALSLVTPKSALALKLLNLAGSSVAGSAPTIPTSLNRLPASAWEKMGLVVGASGGQNHLMKIEGYTRKSAEALQKIAESISPSSTGRSKGPVTAYPQP